MALPRGFSGALRGADPKTLDQRIMNGGQLQRYMPEGEHDVRVVGVDRNQLGDNKLTIKYADANGAEHRDMIFLLNEDRKTGKVDLSWKFMGTLGMLIPDTEAYSALLDELDAGNEDILDLLVGLSGKIVLKRGAGYGPATAQPDGQYVITATERGVSEPVYFRAASIEEAQAAAEGAGYKKAYVNVDRYVPVAEHKANNVATFVANFAASKKAPAKAPFGAGGAGIAIPF